MLFLILVLSTSLPAATALVPLRRDPYRVSSGRWHVPPVRQSVLQLPGRSLLSSPAGDYDAPPPRTDLAAPVPVPSTLPAAIRTFFLAGDYGPSVVVACLLVLCRCRALLPPPASPLSAAAEVSVVLSSVVFWWFQEHFLHRHVLHSEADWIGKEIHEGHHAMPYHHVSIDPAPLLLGWLGAAHLATRCVLPLPLAYSATIGYASAGLFYVWAHYIVHTRVPHKSKFWRVMKTNHARHHGMDDGNWFAFSLPQIDDLFGTNPTVAEARRRLRQKKGEGAETE